MIDEKEVRQLCIRALRQHIMTANISTEEKHVAENLLDSLRKGDNLKKTSESTLCEGLDTYNKSLKAIEKFMISDPLFTGFDGSNPLLVALDKEIRLTLEAKGLLCDKDLSKQIQSRVDW
jgi:hypothetical protein